MRGTNPILAVLGVAVAAVLLAVLVLDSGESGAKQASIEVPGTPGVAFVSPRNGAVQRGTAVVVKVEVENFRLAPRHFGGEPLLGEGNIRFSLNRVPDCVEPEKLKKAEESAIGKGRLLLAGDPAGDLLQQPAAGLLPPSRDPCGKRRRDDPLPRRHQLPDPREAGPPDRRLRGRQGLKCRGGRCSRGRLALLEPILHFV
jgi:hypothetical protein